MLGTWLPTAAAEFRHFCMTLRPQKMLPVLERYDLTEISFKPRCAESGYLVGHKQGGAVGSQGRRPLHHRPGLGILSLCDCVSRASNAERDRTGCGVTSGGTRPHTK